MELIDQTARQLAATIRDRQASAMEVVEAHLHRIDALTRLNAVVTLDAEGALAAARAADAALARGEDVGALHGVPFTLKDMLATKGMRTTVGLNALAEHVPAADGVVAERLKGAGAILLGKTNMAMNVEAESELFGRPRNPWDEERTTGGSSGGAAAALAARMIPLEVGTDMSGSIRMPAHYCGVFGLKPTVHRIPSAGVLFLPNFDLPRIDRWFGVSGPMARSVDDLALAFGILAGPDPRDVLVPPVPIRPPSRRDPSSLRLGVAPVLEGIPSSAAQRRCIEALAQALRDAGAVVEERPLPLPFEELLAAFRGMIRIPLQVAASDRAGPPGSEALLAQPASVADLLAALDEHDRILARFEAFLADVDAWITPVTPDAAFRHRPQGQPIDVDGASVSSQVIDHPCLPATYTGCPSLVVPAGLTEAGLPVGVQLHARRFHDEALLDVGAAVAEVVGPLPPPKLQS